MNVTQLFLLRYNVLYEFWLGTIWKNVPEQKMRKRPHPNVNSIAWNLWHLTRVEDSAVNRFIADCEQVLDSGGWMQRMKVPLRHNGFGMTFPEVDDLSRTVDLKALHGYSGAVQSRTREVVNQLSPESLDETLDEEQLRLILFEEGLAGPNGHGLLENYLGWTKAMCLMNLALTHSFHHMGEISVIASMLGLDT
jgi:uncharacterized damage-inducible protein DinB